MRRARSRCAGGSLSTRMEMKMMLSMPSTSSSAVNVKNAIQTWGSERSATMASMGGRHIRGKASTLRVCRSSAPRSSACSSSAVHTRRAPACNRARCTSGKCRKSPSPPRATTRTHTSTWTCWVELEGPGLQPPRLRLLGWRPDFQGALRRHRARANGAGASRPISPTMPGLQGAGKFRAVAWTAAELAENPNRRGFVRASDNGHALRYADGTPFFLTGDTWLAASTWRLPLQGRRRQPPDYVPAEGISFEEAVAWRKRQGFNSISFIAAFPNWAADEHGATYANKDGVFLRNAWEKFGSLGAEREDLDGRWRDDDGQGHARRAGQSPLRSVRRSRRPREFRSASTRATSPVSIARCGISSDRGFRAVSRDDPPRQRAVVEALLRFQRVVRALRAVPGRALRRVQPRLQRHPSRLDTQGFQPHRGRIQRGADVSPSRSTAPLPFGQPYTTLIDRSTFKAFGHGEQAPWLTMHTVGNNPRNHAIYASIEELFRPRRPRCPPRISSLTTRAGITRSIGPVARLRTRTRRATTTSRAP